MLALTETQIHHHQIRRTMSLGLDASTALYTEPAHEVFVALAAASGAASNSE